MSTSHRPRGRPRTQDIDQRILRATLHLLGEVGYAHMSVDDVARVAGVTRPTIYLRYTNKAELAEAAMTLAREATPLPPPTGNTLTDLAAQLRHFQQGITQPYGLSMIGSLLAEEHAIPDLLVRYREEIVNPRYQMICGVLRAAQLRGEFVTDADIELAASQAIGSYYSLYIRGIPIGPDWPEKLSAQILRGLLKRPDGATD